MNSLQIKKILVPVDFSKTSLNALGQAVGLAKITQAEVIVLHVSEDAHHTSDPLYVSIPANDDYKNQLGEKIAQSMKNVSDKYSSAGVKISSLTSSGRTHKEIIKVSNKVKADIIVMGTHGVSGVREFVMGSNTYRVVSDSKIPVLSVQGKISAGGFKNILLPFSDRPHSREKVIYTIKLAEMYGATIHVLGIAPEKSEAQMKKITRQADQIQGIIAKHNLKDVVKVISKPYTSETVLAYAAKVNADLVVIMGDAEKQDIGEYFSGSIAQQLVNHSPVPVLSVHSYSNPKMMETWQGI